VRDRLNKLIKKGMLMSDFLGTWRTKTGTLIFLVLLALQLYFHDVTKGKLQDVCQEVIRVSKEHTTDNPAVSDLMFAYEICEK
jgi:hypothetical protein